MKILRNKRVKDAEAKRASTYRVKAQAMVKKYFVEGLLITVTIDEKRIE